MKILVLCGSPHPEGTTALLAEEFCAGARAAGHELTRIDVAALDVHPCLGCYACRQPGGGCVFDDDMISLYGPILQAEMIVLVTPLYYYGMTAQLKTVIDRFFAINARLRENPRRALLIAAAEDTDSHAMEGLEQHFAHLCKYLKWQPQGQLLALGADSPQTLSPLYLKKARTLGEGLV